MTIPVIIHRYQVNLASLAGAISKREGISPDQVEARVVGDSLILEIVTDPAMTATRQAPADDKPEPPAEELKGGARAKRAAIIATEGAFLKWAEAADADAATAWIKEQCRVTSRRELDHNPDAGAIFDRIDSRYRAWLDGY